MPAGLAIGFPGPRQARGLGSPQRIAQPRQLISRQVALVRLFAEFLDAAGGIEILRREIVLAGPGEDARERDEGAVGCHLPVRTDLTVQFNVRPGDRASFSRAKLRSDDFPEIPCVKIIGPRLSLRRDLLGEVALHQLIERCRIALLFALGLRIFAV